MQPQEFKKIMDRVKQGIYVPTYDKLVIDTIDIDEVHAFLTADVAAEVEEFTAMQEAELIEALNKHITVEL